MRRIAHISDIHFGREDPELVEGLLAAIRSAKPDLIAVSGDLTQRAKKRQFRQARAFLEALPEVPRVVIPGNHDISATNWVRRAMRPMERFQKYITADLEPFFADDEVALVGLNTVRILAAKDGRINRGQVVRSCARLSAMGPEVVRVVMTHHPLDVPMADEKNALVARSKMAMRAFASCRVDLFLSGHLHAAQTIATSVRYGGNGYSAVVAHAGTAVSTRTRGEANSWNAIEVEAGAIRVQQMVWDAVAGRFRKGLVERYVKGAAGWTSG